MIVCFIVKHSDMELYCVFAVLGACLLLMFCTFISSACLLRNSISNSNVFVNAPYFGSLTHRIRGADGLPWCVLNLAIAVND